MPPPLPAVPEAVRKLLLRVLARPSTSAALGGHTTPDRGTGRLHGLGVALADNRRATPLGSGLRGLGIDDVLPAPAVGVRRRHGFDRCRLKSPAVGARDDHVARGSCLGGSAASTRDLLTLGAKVGTPGGFDEADQLLQALQVRLHRDGRDQQLVLHLGQRPDNPGAEPDSASTEILPVSLVGQQLKAQGLHAMTLRSHLVDLHVPDGSCGVVQLLDAAVGLLRDLNLEHRLFGGRQVPDGFTIPDSDELDHGDDRGPPGLEVSDAGPRVGGLAGLGLLGLERVLEASQQPPEVAPITRSNYLGTQELLLLRVELPRLLATVRHDVDLAQVELAAIRHVVPIEQQSEHAVAPLHELDHGVDLCRHLRLGSIRQLRREYGELGVSGQRGDGDGHRRLRPSLTPLLGGRRHGPDLGRRLRGVGRRGGGGDGRSGHGSLLRAYVALNLHDVDVRSFPSMPDIIA